MTSFEYESYVRDDETERAALLCEEFANVYIDAAKKARADGSYTVRRLWGKPATHVKPGWENWARHKDYAAKALLFIATRIRSGDDPRTQWAAIAEKGN